MTKPLPVILPCPKCKSSGAYSSWRPAGHHVQCLWSKCDAEGPLCTTERGSITAWNRMER